MIHTLPSPKTKQKAKRIGRGMGSGVGGHTVGRGLKGATARAGHKDPRPGFEGGQNPISRRLPKLKGSPKKGHGFTSGGFKIANILNAPIQLSILVERAEAMKKSEITLETLVELGLLKPKFSKNVKAKVLFDKDISQPIILKGIVTSKTAKTAIEKAGGKVE